MSVNISVYSQAHCQQCVATKRRFAAAAVPVEETRADLDKTVADQLRAEGFLQVPVIKVWHADGTVEDWTGFNPERIDAAIEAYRRDKAAS